jgi:hypothetical protein
MDLAVWIMIVWFLVTPQTVKKLYAAQHVSGGARPGAWLYFFQR